MIAKYTVVPVPTDNGTSKAGSYGVVRNVNGVTSDVAFFQMRHQAKAVADILNQWAGAEV